jgi:hypothetical protein
MALSGKCQQMTGDHWLRKHTNKGTSPQGPWLVGNTTLKREQSNDSRLTAKDDWTIWEQTLSLWGASCCVIYIYYIWTYNIKLYICGPQTQLTTSLFSKTSLHVSAPTGHLQVITIVMTFNTCCFEDSHSTAIHPLYSWLWGLSTAS